MTACNPPVWKRLLLPRFEGIDLKSKVISEDSSAFWTLELTPEQKKTCQEALRAFLSARNHLDKEFYLLTINRLPKHEVRAKMKCATLNENTEKNRYMDVLPFDDTRVIRQQTKGSGSDYINASFIEGPSNKLPRFIATQGPLRSTVVDFWEMVMQQRCSVIVMLTSLSDGNLEKCAPYFPTSAGQSQVYGRLRVTNKLVTFSRFSIVKRVLQVQAVEQAYEYPLNVLHFEYLHWPDHGVPPSTGPVRELFKCVCSVSHDIPHDTFVVHCSAGIGRCGTYISIDHTLRRLLLGDLSAMDIKATVQSYRRQRHGMIQTKAQYCFCYAAVIDEVEEFLLKKPDQPKSHHSVVDEPSTAEENKG